MRTEELLRMSLSAAVGIRLMQWKHDPSKKPDPFEHIACLECKGQGKENDCFTCGSKAGEGAWFPRNEALSMLIASRGDALMYKTPGVTAMVFNALAESLALMAYFPGGVTAFGHHWEVPSKEEEPQWAKKLKKVLTAVKLKKPI